MRILIATLVALAAIPAAAQERASHCIAIAEMDPALRYVQPASFRGGLSEFEVRLIYIDHSMFLIETGGGVTAVTDYAGFIGAVDFVPDIVTMNHAHGSHWTAAPDPRIETVLRGWTTPEPVERGDLYVRSVPTDIRRGASVEVEGNSIFVFEVAGLCIGHLGHLHHEPDDAQYAALGRLDVVMAPVDGGLTLPRPTLKRMLERLRSSVVIPMHWFGRPNLEAFVAEMSDTYAVERPGGASLTLSLRDLPDRPTIVLLEPAFLRAPE